MQFIYAGRDGSGRLLEGDLDALSIEEAARNLAGRGITLLKLEEVAGADGLLNTAREWWIAHSSVPLDDLIVFCRQMHALSRSGIPILRSIRGLSETGTSPLLCRNLKLVADKLDSGFDLAVCLSNHPKIFNDLFIAMIHVGENTGNLEGAFKQLGSSLDRERATRQRIQQATRYPIMVIGALVTAMLIINVWVIPSFTGVFERLGSDLPIATQILMVLSNFILHKWWLILLVVFGTGFSFNYWVGTPSGRYEWDKRKLRLPIMGELLNLTAMSRFSRNFSMMLAAGLPITQALTLVSNAVGNTYIGKAVEGMREGIERGDSLLNTAHGSGMFSSLIMQMIAVGEETGRVDEMLDEVAEFYDQEVDYKVSRLSDAIEPILLFAMGIMVLVLALGVFLPIWSLAEVSVSR